MHTIGKIALVAIAIFITGCTQAASPKDMTPTVPTPLPTGMILDAAVSSDNVSFPIESTFDNQTPDIYIIAKIVDAPKDTTVSAKWIYVDNVADNQYHKFNEVIFMDTCLVTGTRDVSFMHSGPTEGWRYGRYQVSLYLNEKEGTLVQFDVIRPKTQFQVSTPGNIGIQPITPGIGQLNVPVTQVKFSWNPWWNVNVNKYQFDLARDASFKQIITSTFPTTTNYEYAEILDYGKNYFWRVRPTIVNRNPVFRNWSATFSFQTKKAPASIYSDNSSP